MHGGSDATAELFTTKQQGKFDTRLTQRRRRVHFMYRIRRTSCMSRQLQRVIRLFSQPKLADFLLVSQIATTKLER